jgi:hypothetical protein
MKERTAVLELIVQPVDPAFVMEYEIDAPSSADAVDEGVNGDCCTKTVNVGAQVIDCPKSD